MKANLTLTLDRTITVNEASVRIALTVNGWIPHEVEVSDSDVKKALQQASEVLEGQLFGEPPKVERQCSNCDFFEIDNHECRRRSPIHAGSRFELPIFPVVSDSHWCGEFKRWEQP